MNIEAFIQLLRTCNLAQVRAELEKMKKLNTVTDQQMFTFLENFYQRASRQEK